MAETVPCALIHVYSRRVVDIDPVLERSGFTQIFFMIRAEDLFSIAFAAKLRIYSHLSYACDALLKRTDECSSNFITNAYHNHATLSYGTEQLFQGWQKRIKGIKTKIKQVKNLRGILCHCICTYPIVTTGAAGGIISGTAHHGAFTTQTKTHGFNSADLKKLVII